MSNLQEHTWRHWLGQTIYDLILWGNEDELVSDHVEPYLEKMKVNPYCFIQAWNTRFDVRCVAPKLSYHNCGASTCGRPISYIKDLNQTISVVVSAIAWYSASMEDRATIFCFQVVHEIKLRPINITNALMSFLSSTHPTQSASEYAFNVEIDVDEKTSPKSNVPHTYRNILLTPFQCLLVGAWRN